MNLILSLWLFRMLHFAIQDMISNLDENIGVAVTNLVEKFQAGEIGGEPPNEIRAAIAQFITQKMNQAPIAEVIKDRGVDGKFLSG